MTSAAEDMGCTAMWLRLSGPATREAQRLFEDDHWEVIPELGHIPNLNRHLWGDYYQPRPDDPLAVALGMLRPLP